MRLSRVLRSAACGLCLASVMPLVPALAQAPAAATPASEPAAAPAPPDPASARAADPPPSGDVAAQRLADRLRLIHVDAEITWLESDVGAFLALHHPADEPLPTGGLVIIGHPGSVVGNLPALYALTRTAPAGGWSVLSIHPGGPGSDAAAVGARIAAGLRYFADQQLQNIVVVSDGDGVPLMLEAVAAAPSAAIAGLVGLGAWAVDNFEGIDVALLDIAGSRDARAMRSQQQREMLARKYPNTLEVVAIDGAGPDFHGYADQTARRVRGWLLRAAPAELARR